MGAGVIGALSFAFSDTFWFSAVEGEVYASSSLFTAIVFLAILKWDECADEPYANRWLILIAYLMGLFYWRAPPESFGHSGDCVSVLLPQV